MRKDILLIILGFAVVAAATYFILDATLERPQPELTNVVPDEPPVVQEKKAATSDKAKEVAQAGLPPEEKASAGEDSMENESESDDADSADADAANDDSATQSEGDSASSSPSDSGDSGADDSGNKSSDAMEQDADAGSEHAAASSGTDTASTSASPDSTSSDATSNSASSGTNDTEKSSGASDDTPNVTIAPQAKSGGEGEEEADSSDTSEAGETASASEDTDTPKSDSAQASSSNGSSSSSSTADSGSDASAKASEDASDEPATSKDSGTAKPVQFSGEPAKKGDKIVAKGVVNIRAEGTTDSAVVGQLQPGDIVTVTADAKNAWAEIKNAQADKQGWVYLPLFRYPVGAPETPVAVPDSDTDTGSDSQPESGSE